MTIEITRELAAERISTFATEGRLIQSAWHSEQDGRELACILGAIGKDVNSPEDCPASVMPAWLAHLIPTLFDNVPEDKALEYGARFAEALRTGNTDETVLRGFLVKVVEGALEDARKVSEKEAFWSEVQGACEGVIEGLKTGAKSYSPEMEAARSAAESAVWSAARSAARSAAESAAYERMFDTLINLMAG